MTHRTWGMTLSASLTAIALLATTAWADFRHTRPGPRPRAMGSAFVAVSDDANAVYWNPAGLMQMQSFEITGCRTLMYSVDELNNDYVSMAYNWADRLAVGMSWVRLGLEDIYNEDTINLSLAAEVPGVDNLSLGASYKLFMLEAPGYEKYNDPAYEGRVTEPSLDLGVHYHPKKNWALGAVAYNVNEPTLQLLRTTADPDPVLRQYAIGVSYLFRDLLLTSFDLRTRNGSFDDTSGRVGSELWFFDAVALRGGFVREFLTAGMGLKGKQWQIDVMLESHDELGNTYQLAATIKL